MHYHHSLHQSAIGISFIEILVILLLIAVAIFVAKRTGTLKYIAVGIAGVGLIGVLYLTLSYYRTQQFDYSLVPPKMSQSLEKTGDRSDFGSTSGDSRSFLPSPAEPSDLARKKSNSTNLPEWIKNSHYIDSRGRYCIVIQAGPYSDLDDFQDPIDISIESAVSSYIARLLQRPVNSNSLVRIPMEEIKQKIEVHNDPEINTPFISQREHSFGTMYTKYILLRFTPKMQQEIKRRAKSALVEYRLEGTAIFGLLILGMLGTIYGSLRLDSYSKGFYTKRLIIGGSILILVMISLIVVVTRSYGGFFFDSLTSIY